MLLSIIVDRKDTTRSTAYGFIVVPFYSEYAFFFVLYIFLRLVNPTLEVDMFVDRSVNCSVSENTNPVKTALIIGSIFNIVPVFFAGMPLEISIV